MKASVVITLIICGTVLLIIPYIHNTIAVVTRTMAALDKNVDVTADVPT